MQKSALAFPVDKSLARAKAVLCYLQGAKVTHRAATSHSFYVTVNFQSI